MPNAPVPPSNRASITDAVLDTPLLRFSEHPADTWTIRDAVMGTQIFGGTGSGKTSGSGQAIARAFLRNKFGGLVLTAKEEDRGNWERWMEQEQHPGQLLHIQAGGQYWFNFIEYLYDLYPAGTGAGLTQNLVGLFMTALSSGNARASSADPYWDDALRQMLTHAVDLIALAQGPGRRVTLHDISDVIRTAPQSRADVHSTDWRRGACWRFLQAAEERFATMTPADRVAADGQWRDIQETRDYWLLDFAGLAERTRSVVVSSFTSRVTHLLRSPLRELLCSELPANFGPDMSFKGNIILFDLPVKTYGEVGRTAQVLFKTVWQRATESSRRNPKDADARPVFLWADESQYFVTSEDMLFQQTARSKQAATVYLTQNLPNYHAALDSTGRSAATDSLLGNLSTKIFHANGDPTTNEWAERVFAHGIATRSAPSYSGDHAGASTQYQVEPVVRASAFTVLDTAEAIVFVAGRPWASSFARKTALKFRVNQSNGSVIPATTRIAPTVGKHDGSH
jgi:hypothetical protein